MVKYLTAMAATLLVSVSVFSHSVVLTKSACEQAMQAELDDNETNAMVFATHVESRIQEDILLVTYFVEGDPVSGFCGIAHTTGKVFALVHDIHETRRRIDEENTL